MYYFRTIIILSNLLVVFASSTALAGNRLIGYDDKPIVIDTLLKAVWDRSPRMNRWELNYHGLDRFEKQSDARAYCASLELEGINGFRLPTKEEITSIAESNLTNEMSNPFSQWDRLVTWIDAEGMVFDRAKHNAHYPKGGGSDGDGAMTIGYFRTVDDGIHYPNDPMYVKCIAKGVAYDKALNDYNNRRQAENNELERQQAKEKIEENAHERKVTAFRKSIREGDDTTDGVVVQVKGNLVKIQTNESQCSQRDYDGNCKNWISTPIEKWFKRNEINPIN